MLQVVTYNLGGARKLRPERMAELGIDVANLLETFIDPQKPTFIAIQESSHARAGMVGMWNVDSQLQRTIDKSILGSYKCASWAEVWSRNHPHARLWTRPVYEGASYGTEGNAMVTNLKGAHWAWEQADGHMNFPGWDPDFHWWTHTQISRASVYSTGSRDTQPRNALIATLTHEEYGDLFFINTHLGAVTGENRHDPNDPKTQEGIAQREWQAGEILRVVDELRRAEIDNNKLARPIILAGDFNALPDSSVMQKFAEQFTLLDVDNPETERYTHTGHKILIDHILVSDPRGVLPTVQAHIHTDVPDDMTDHLPVYAIFGE